MKAKYIAPIMAAGIALTSCAGVPDKAVTGNVVPCEERTGAYNIGYGIGQDLRSLFGIGAGVAYTAVTKDLSGLLGGVTQTIEPEPVNNKECIDGKLSN